MMRGIQAADKVEENMSLQRKHNTIHITDCISFPDSVSCATAAAAAADAWTYSTFPLPQHLRLPGQSMSLQISRGDHHPRPDELNRPDCHTVNPSSRKPDSSVTEDVTTVLAHVMQTLPSKHPVREA